MLTQKCNGEIWLKNNCMRYENIKWISLRIRDRMSVERTSFWIVPRNIYFVPYLHGTIFRYFLYIWLYYALWLRFDSKTGTGCLLRNLLLLFLLISRSRYTLHFPALFKALRICWFYTCGFHPSGFHMVLIVLPQWLYDSPLTEEQYLVAYLC